MRSFASARNGSPWRRRARYISADGAGDGDVASLAEESLGDVERFVASILAVEAAEDGHELIGRLRRLAEAKERLGEADARDVGVFDVDPELEKGERADVEAALDEPAGGAVERRDGVADQALAGVELPHRAGDWLDAIDERLVARDRERLRERREGTAREALDDEDVAGARVRLARDGRVARLCFELGEPEQRAGVIRVGAGRPAQVGDRFPRSPRECSLDDSHENLFRARAGPGCLPREASREGCCPVQRNRKSAVTVPRILDDSGGATRESLGK